MQTTKKQFVRFGRIAGKGVILGTLALSVAGCVAEPSPRGYYGTYPNNANYYHAPAGSTVVTEPGSTVIVRDRPGYYHDDNRPVRDYDNRWDYGRRGNGNFHGTGDDDVHDDN